MNEIKQKYKRAILENNTRELSILLKRFSPTLDHNYPLRLAVDEKMHEIVRILLQDPRVDPMDFDEDDVPFINAVNNNDIEMVKLLMPRVDVEKYRETVINICVYDNNPEILKLLLKKIAPFDADAFRASYDNHTEILKILLKDGRSDPSYHNNFIIKEEARRGHIEIVKLLLKDPRVDPSADGNQAIRYASYLYEDTLEEYFKSSVLTEPSSKNSDKKRQIVELLLTDPRVDWRLIEEPMKSDLFNEKKELLKKEIESGLFSIRETAPKNTIDGNKYSLIPKNIRKNIVLRAPYMELCKNIGGEHPPMKLVALSEFLNIKSDTNISWRDLCNNVKAKLLLLY